MRKVKRVIRNMNLIITSGNGRNFNQLKNFVTSLRSNGDYKDNIAICDCAISGEWNAPGTWSKESSFTNDQITFFHEFDVKVYHFQALVEENKIDEQVIKSIKSPTQRYPYKFIYNVLISKKYLNKVNAILYFDSDIYFQRPVKQIFNEVEEDKIIIVKEWLKMKEGDYLKKWLGYSNFSSISSQKMYDNSMFEADNFCSGFYGSTTEFFHKFNLVALLLTSNQFVNFYSDQPLINILKTFFKLPFKEINWHYCLHLGELSHEKYYIKDGFFALDKIVPICVHFNCGKYHELESVLEGMPLAGSVTSSVYKRAVKKVYRNIRQLVGQ